MICARSFTLSENGFMNRSDLFAAKVTERLPDEARLVMRERCPVGMLEA
jgi:hypothetical protein